MNKTNKTNKTNLADKNFWQNKKVLITGHTGFKGAWLCILLKQFQSKIFGIALPPENQSLFNKANVNALCEKSIFLDINNEQKIAEIIQEINPEIIIHLAAQALVRPSYSQPLNTFKTNIIGTANILNTAKNLTNLKSIVCITTDKVYHNNEWHYPYREIDKLGGYDPYSASKAAAEIVIDSYRKSFFDTTKIGVASARAGNVIGGGDWSLDRLIPDIIKSWLNDKEVIIRSPNSIRPWQHVLEPLNAYLILAENLYKQPQKFSKSYNFGPDSNSQQKVIDILENIKTYFVKNNYAANVKYETENNNNNNLHEAGILTLDTNLAKNELNIFPKWNLQTTLERTANWYILENSNTKSAQNLCLDDINFYFK